MLVQGLLQGGALLAVTLAIYVWALQAGRGEAVSRTLSILGLTAGNLLLVAVNLTAGLGWRSLMVPGARAFWWVSLAAAAALTVAVVVPGARQLLHFDVPAATDLAMALGAVALAVSVGGALGAWARRR